MRAEIRWLAHTIPWTQDVNLDVARKIYYHMLNGNVVLDAPGIAVLARAAH